MKNAVSRELVLERVNKWLDTVEEADAWNNDGGELFGQLKLTAVHSGHEGYVSIMCVEELAEESLG